MIEHLKKANLEEALAYNCKALVVDIISVSVTVSQASMITTEAITCSQEPIDSTDANIVETSTQYGKKRQISPSDY